MFCESNIYISSSFVFGRIDRKKNPHETITLSNLIESNSPKCISFIYCRLSSNKCGADTISNGVRSTFCIHAVFDIPASLTELNWPSPNFVAIDLGMTIHAHLPGPLFFLNGPFNQKIGFIYVHSNILSE